MNGKEAFSVSKISFPRSYARKVFTLCNICIDFPVASFVITKKCKHLEVYQWDWKRILRHIYADIRTVQSRKRRVTLFMGKDAKDIPLTEKKPLQNSMCNQPLHRNHSWRKYKPKCEQNKHILYNHSN